jgi:integrase
VLHEDRVTSKPEGRRSCGSADVKALHEVTPVIAEAYASDLWGSEVSPATYNAHMNFLRGMFKVLKTQAGLAQNVWQALPNMELETQSRRELKPKELAKVCSTATGEMRYLFAVGLYTGMRLGDVCMLTWDEIDLKKGVIEHMPMKTKRKGKVLRLPIHPVLDAMLLGRERQQFFRNGSCDHVQQTMLCQTGCQVLCCITCGFPVKFDCLHLPHPTSLNIVRHSCGRSACPRA